jgi:competence protein ComEC
VARLLAVTVTGLVLVDPLLVWSVGFWLSVTATAGVCVVGPWLEPRLGGPAWLAAPLAVTLGAQAGVIVPSWLVFGRMPSLGIVANLLAVPVAGELFQSVARRHPEVGQAVSRVEDGQLS